MRYDKYTGDSVKTAPVFFASNTGGKEVILKKCYDHSKFLRKIISNYSMSIFQITKTKILRLL